MYKLLNITAAFAFICLLTGCPKPIAKNVVYDSKIHNASGTITLSDPKLYSREALISERAKDIKWIDALIENSENPDKVKFTPGLVLEVEQITAMAAAIGLKFDPAAALQYNRDKETGDTQHEIEVLQLQLQLDQLKRDAKLVRDQFEAQTSPVNEDINKLEDGSTQASDSITVNAADQLSKAIESIITSLETRLDVDGKEARGTKVKSSPFDDFRDRSAYRDMLKAAKNAASLDELHDYSNSRLIRLNFQASAIPDSKYPRSLGAIQMVIIPPNPNSASMQQFLWNWLVYFNTNEEYRTEKGNKLNKNNKIIKELLLSSYFETLDVDDFELLLPVLKDTDGQTHRPENIYKRAMWAPPTDPSIDTTEKNYTEALNLLSDDDTSDAIYNAICGNSKAKGSDKIAHLLQVAIDRDLTRYYILLAEKVAQLKDKGKNLMTEDRKNRLNSAGNFRNQVLNRMSEKDQCEAFVKLSRDQPQWSALVDPIIVDNDTVRIYEIGPREQVQQVSTVTRSASSLALAANIAASDPGSGIGAEAAGSYSRQIMARATSLQRVPSVVGYSQAGKKSFGWVLGPQAVLDKYGKVDIAQLLKTYDLSVDLSVPGWWSAFDLKVTTTWAPSPTLLASGTLSENKYTNTFNVPLLRYEADDFTALAKHMTGIQDRSVFIKTIEGGPVNACAQSTLIIKGSNIWRAKKVFFLDQVLGEKNITIMPDMEGILLSVPPVTPLINGNFDENLYIMTPLGTASFEQNGSFKYIAEPSGKKCKPAETQANSSDPNKISISKVYPTEFIVPAEFTIRVTGKNMGKIDEVRLYNQKGNTVLAKDGKSLEVTFDESTTSGIPAGSNIELTFYEKDKIDPTLTRNIRITQRQQ
ncbi:MAG: hypothetical protein BA863_07595 [Desulfovibrio sp. S3730MH75]|nr:MAG: hypothetical protein BA863_07595 [Desulfovibrio sp. S3730MH75]